MLQSYIPKGAIGILCFIYENPLIKGGLNVILTPTTLDSKASFGLKKILQEKK
jgi:hypothetical protein